MENSFEVKLLNWKLLNWNMVKLFLLATKLYLGQCRTIPRAALETLRMPQQNYLVIAEERLLCR